MQASETKLRQLIEGTKQFVIPLYQRPYTWTAKQWKTLWADIVEQSHHDDAHPHFFGSIVTAPAKSVPQGVAKYILIDGQQRLTTTQVFLAAVRDVADAIGDVRLRDRIDGQYLRNAYEENDEQFKLLPTQDDRRAFRTVIDGGTAAHGRLYTCYEFYRARLSRLTPQELERVHLAIVDRLSVVSITCDERDNPHLIFESLNAKGEKLTPADLIRNYLLMKVHVNDQERLYTLYWLPIQQAFGEGLTEFVRHYLMKGGKILTTADVYFELKDRLASATPAETELLLKDMHRHGQYYERFVDPSSELDGDVGERLARLASLKMTVVYPFLLRIFDAYDDGSLTRGQLLEALDVLESFLIRRSICNMPTNQLRRMMPPVFDAAGGACPTFIDGLRVELGGRRCPDDAAFADALATEPLYASAEKNARLRLILERLESSFRHKEPAAFAAATIEHVLPQTLTDEWRSDLGDSDGDQTQALLHTLGNLTLTGYNPELSNLPFCKKKAVLAGSHFELNREISAMTHWTLDAVRKRGQSLAQRALNIWRDVGREAKPVRFERQPTQPPAVIRFRRVQRPVRSWKEAFTELVGMLEENDPGLLSRIEATKSLVAAVTTDENRFHRSKAAIGGVYLNTHASAVQLREWCRKITEFAQIPITDYEFLPKPLA